MKAKQINDNWLLRFELGDDFTEALTAWANQNDVKSGFFHGLGGATQATLGFYVLAEKKYNWRDFDQALEVVSLHGNLSIANDQQKIHAHGVLSDSDFKTYGGHINKLIAGPTLEILVTKFDQIISRSLDPEIGLDLLDL